MARQKLLICPYCGEPQPVADACRACRGSFDPEERQARSNAMGPWFIRDEARLGLAGRSYEQIVELVDRGEITRLTILRGPTTRQLWTVARRVPGVSHLVGYCHQCGRHVDSTHHECPDCGAAFGAYLDRNYLGLPDINPLPWEPAFDRNDVSPYRRVAAASPGSAGRGFAWPASGGRAAPGAGGGRPERLSAFATDEELRAASSEPAAEVDAEDADAVQQAEADRVAEQEETTAAAPAAADARPASEPTEPAESPSAGSTLGATLHTSLLRRIDRQQRTIRLLTALVLLVAVAAVIANAIIVNRVRTADSPPAPVVTEPDASASTAPAPPDDRDDDVAEQAAPEAAATPTSDETTAPTPYDAELARAQKLIERGDDENRPLDERIAAYEEAIAILTNAAEQLGEAQPADLAERIAAAEAALDRLRLQEFFP